MTTILNYTLDSGIFLWGGFAAVSGVIIFQVIRENYILSRIETISSDKTDIINSLTTQEQEFRVFQEKISRAIQADLDRIHATVNPIERISRAIQTEKLDTLNDVLLSSPEAATQLELNIQNSANMIASNPQIADLVNLF